ncbi:MAG: NADH:ubiquinone reductase (Na(+)-transporting) subunit F [Bacteroidales bacterium]|nr:NADH:ubiquinone reductase (Na(+)-transporting) subunit F [Bacteroidales bacterium]
MNKLTIISAVVVFLLLAWGVVALLLWFRRKWVPEGKVKITINGDKTIEHERGCSLLQALADEKIWVPSACGGSGTCGACKGKVLSGGGSLLPTEQAHITRAMAEDHYRLFCQVKLRENMEIELPSEILGVKKYPCRVVSNRNVSTFIKELVLQLPEGESLNFRSGSYIQIDIPKYKLSYSAIQIEEKYHQDWQRMGLFDLSVKNNEPTVRAYSMANAPVENGVVMLNVRIAVPPFDKKKNQWANVPPGISSSYLFSLNPGDQVSVSGPYGDFFVEEGENEMMFIGGGAGMAPMRSHLVDQLVSHHTKRKISFWYGGRSLKELFYLEDLDKLQNENDNFSYHIALSEPQPEDDWTGYVGFIHQVIFDNYLKNHPNPEDIDYFICGPPMMLKAVLSMLDQLGVAPENIHYDDFGA